MIHPSEECQGRRTLTGIMGVNEECVKRAWQYHGSRSIRVVGYFKGSREVSGE